MPAGRAPLREAPFPRFPGPSEDSEAFPTRYPGQGELSDEPVRKLVFGVKPKHKATMRKSQNRKSEALNQAVAALIEEAGQRPEVILGDWGSLAHTKKAQD